jgi:hypothetical protein
MNRLITILLTAIAITASGAEPKVTDLDWEPACGGSHIRVTTVDNKIALIEANAQHFAEAREWICAFSGGVLISATFRSYKVGRSAETEKGEFAITTTLEKAAVFAAKDGVPQKMDAALKKDLDSVLAIVTSSMGRAI